MFDAYEPYVDRLINIKDYEDRVARGEFGSPTLPDPARCPLCKEGLQCRAGHTKDDRHFAHPINPANKCRLKPEHGLPYVHLPPRVPDPVAEQQNIQFMKAHFDAIFARMSESADMIPFFDLGEFVELLREARRLRAYAYQGVEGWMLPYVLCTLRTFLPKDSKKDRDKKPMRKMTFRFYYDAGVPDLQELWINKGNGAQLFRATYSGKTLRNVVHVAQRQDYLTLKASLSDKQRDWILREI